MPGKRDCGNCGCPVAKDTGVVCHLEKHQTHPPTWFHFISCPECGLECWDEHIGSYHQDEDD